MDLFHKLPSGGVDKYKLIRELIKLRIRSNPEASMMGFESMVDQLSELQLLGTIEGGIVTIVETWSLLIKKGIPEEEIFTKIETHRSGFGDYGELPSPLTLSNYIKYRVHIENDTGIPFDDDFIEKAVEICKEEYLKNPESKNEQEVDIPEEEKFCMNCGAKIPANAEICPMCGAKQSSSDTRLEEDTGYYGKKWFKGLQFFRNLFKSGKKGAVSDKQERELMKSLCLGFVGDIAQLLSDLGFNKPIKVSELITFAMFVVTESYTLSQKGLDKASPRLDQFHLDMVDYVANEYFLKENTVTNDNEIFAFRDQFYNVVTTRYAEYRPLFIKDVSKLIKHDPGMIFGKKTLSALLNHLFAEPISEDDKPHLIAPMSLIVLEFYTECIQSFK